MLKLNFLSIVFLFFGCLNLSAQTSLQLKFKRSAVYAGIEVGAKGVKMSLVELGKNPGLNSPYSIITDSVVNTGLISFTAATFQSSLNAIAGLYKTALSFYHIPANRIYTVVSSEVKISAAKNHKTLWVEALIDSFQVRIKDPSLKVPIEDVADEARLSHLGIVPESKRYTTFLINIGSTKILGCYFPRENSNQVEVFQLARGVKSIANATINSLDGDSSPKNYNSQLQQLLQGEVNKEIVQGLNVSGDYKMSDNIAFSGSAAWAIATLLFPELIYNPVVPVTFEQVKKLNEKLFSDYHSFSENEMIKQIKDSTLDKNAIAHEINNVNKVFDQKTMLAASGLLLDMMHQFESLEKRKQFYLIKNGEAGWILAHINKNIER